MYHQQKTDDVNSEAPKITLCHCFPNGQHVAFKLWRKKNTLEWEPDLPDGPMPRSLVREYYQWYGFVLGRVLEHWKPNRKVVESNMLVNENGGISGWHVEFFNGLRIEVETPHELFYIATATKDSRDVTSGLNLHWLSEFVQAFVFRIPTA